MLRSPREGNITYQWRLNGIDLPGANAATLSLASAQPGDAGSYDVVIANDAGSVTSAVATLTVRLMDYGDAPSPFPTLTVDNGARHLIVPGVYLGSTVDYETTGQPDATATGDDLNGDDEDGITFTSPLTVGEMATVDVVASVNGFLDAWIDFNGNGSWADPGEQIFASQSLTPGVNSLSFLVPLNAATPNSFARFRFSTAGGLSFDGPAADGEVEDYAVPLALIADVSVAVSANPDPVAVGGNLTYTVTINNTGPSPAGVTTLTGVLPANASFVSAVADQGSCQNDSGTLTCALGTVPAGAAPTVTITVSPTSIGPLEFQANVTSSPLDQFPLNNQARATATALAAPAIVTAPENRNVNQGDTATLTVVASGSSLAYQWTFDGAELPGETQATLTIPNAQFANQGTYTVRISNAVGSLESDPVTLSVLSIPIIVVPPANTTAYAGSDVTLTVQASGTMPLEYQWYVNGGTPLPGANSATLALANVQAADSGNYTVQVNNIAGTVTSDAAQLTVHEADFGDAPDPTFPTLLANDGARHLLVPGIYLGTTVDFESDGQPDANAQGDDAQTSNDDDGVSFTSPLLLGQTATLQVVASTSGFLNAWVDFNRNGSWADAGEQVFQGHALAAGVNEVSFTVPVAAVPGATIARFRFSTAETLSFVGEAPDGEVEDYSISIGGASDLAVVQVAVPNPVVVSGLLTYAITVNNNGPSTATGVVLTDFLPAQATFSDVVTGQGSCTVNAGIITCNLGSLAANSSAAVTVRVIPTTAGALTNITSAAATQTDVNLANNTTPLVAQVQELPMITAQPQSQVVGNGATATFTVAATGTSLRYQWRLGGTSLSGRTNASLVITNAQLAQAGDYTVRVYNGVGEALSTPATLTVLALPVILTQPQTQIVAEGATVTFSVTAQGTPPLSYQWFLNGSEFIGAFQSSLILNDVSDINEGDYTVRITNEVGSVVSDPATLTIIVPPQVTSQPLSRTNFAGTTAELSVTATGDEPLQYQWYFNGNNPIAGATSATLALENIQSSQSGNYHVKVSNATGSDTSADAIVTVWEVDLGDAPDPGFPTLVANNGAAHIIRPGIYLGTGVDFETDGQPEAAAQGDDTNGSDDEDGVNFVTPWRVGQTATIEVVASTAGFLDAWMDFNHNGTWADFGEKIFDARALAAGVNQLPVTVPADALTGDGFARFRFSTSGDLSYDGLAEDGEVEDYAVTVSPAIDLAITQTGKVTAVPLGQNLTYTLPITNLGPSTATGVMLSNRLPVDVTFVSANIGQGSCAQDNGVVICDLGTLAGGEGTVATLVVTPLNPGGITDVVSVRADQFDVNSANNTLSDSTAVVVAAGSFANPNLLDVLDNGPASPYPSTILVSGLTSSVYKVTVTLSNVTHTYPDDMDILLVGPGGQNVVLMSDSGSGNTLADVTLTFDDDAPEPISDSGIILPGSYRPANNAGTNDVFPPPAPVGPFGVDLSVYYKTDPNGIWSLYVVDDAEEDFGQITDGWRLNFDTLDPIADLGLTLEGPTGPVPPGTSLTYTLTVHNSRSRRRAGCDVDRHLDRHRKHRFHRRQSGQLPEQQWRHRLCGG